MKKIYFDNASTTAIRPEVIQEMIHVMQNEYGNASSTHSIGRSAKNILELSRKSIAKHFNCAAQEIVFTSGGTESNNLILHSVVKDLKVKRIISSKIEHHAVLHPILELQKVYGIQVDYVNIKPNGAVDLTHLSELLSQNPSTLVSLMHVNNEIGTILNLQQVGILCKQYHAFFHTDAVQSVGKIEMDLQNSNVNFLSASAHKFHGPKGVGFAFIAKNSGLQPLLFGGEQEKGLRPGTEAIHQIAGMAKALELSYENLTEEKAHILSLKNYLLQKLATAFPNFRINGENTLCNIVNVLLPFPEEKTGMILFNLDMKGIAVSRGSACQSGSIQPSHVLAEILSVNDIKKPSIRISFSHFNTMEEIDYLIDSLKQINVN